MLFPLQSKQWLIFAKSYFNRNMCYPMYADRPWGLGLKEPRQFPNRPFNVKAGQPVDGSHPHPVLSVGRGWIWIRFIRLDGGQALLLRFLRGDLRHRSPLTQGHVQPGLQDQPGLDRRIPRTQVSPARMWGPFLRGNSA